MSNGKILIELDETEGHADVASAPEIDALVGEVEEAPGVQLTQEQQTPPVPETAAPAAPATGTADTPAVTLTDVVDDKALFEDPGLEPNS